MPGARASIQSNCSFLSPLRLCLPLLPPPNIQMVRSRTCTIIRIGFVWPPSPHCFSSVPFLPPIMLLASTTFFLQLFFLLKNDPASLLIMQPLAIQLCSLNFTFSLISAGYYLFGYKLSSSRLSPAQKERNEKITFRLSFPGFPWAKDDDDGKKTEESRKQRCEGRQSTNKV